MILKCVVLDIWPFISDKWIQLLSGTWLCKPRELSQRGSSTIQLCNIHYEFASMIRVWPQCCQAVASSRDKMCDFVALVWPIRSLVITTSSAFVRCLDFLVAQVLVSRDKVLYHVQTHPTWFEPPVGYKNSPHASNLQSEQFYGMVKGLLC